MNLYAYVGNDPVNATDPSGLRSSILCRQDGPICQSFDFPDEDASKKEKKDDSTSNISLRDIVETNRNNPNNASGEPGETGAEIGIILLELIVIISEASDDAEAVGEELTLGEKLLIGIQGLGVLGGIDKGRGDDPIFQMNQSERSALAKELNNELSQNPDRNRKIQIQRQLRTIKQADKFDLVRKSSAVKRRRK